MSVNGNAVQDQDLDLDIQHYLDVLLRRRWIIASVTLITVLTTSMVVFSTRPTYLARALLLIEKERTTSRVADGMAVESTQDDYYQTQYMLLKSDSLLERVYDDLDLSKQEDFAQPKGLAKLRGAVDIAPVRRSRLVNVEVQSHDRDLAARISNGIAETYVKQNVENQLFISKEVLQALEVDPHSSEGRRLQESLPAVVNNPLIQNLKADYAKLQAQAADVAKRYTPKHPSMLAITSNMTALESQIRAETDRVVQSLKTELSGQLKGNNVRIVDRAKVPDQVYKPRKGRALMISLLGGFLGACLLAMLIELLDQSVRTSEDVENKLQLPFLGTIPYLQMPGNASPYQPLISTESSLTSEAFRNLRTMVSFASADGKKQPFLVTSALQEEGKSYISSNLAVAFAQLGETVLLVDGDLRRPKMHANFRLSKRKGLSDFLASGKDVGEVEPLIQSTDVPNLKVLVCGTKPPNPSELLNTPRLEAFLNWAKSRFGRVIVDCPPMFPIHDTLLWGRCIPSAVFVVRFGKTRSQQILDAGQRLSTGNVKVLGVVVNAAKAGGLAYAAYGYHYKQYYHDYRIEPSETIEAQSD